MLVELSALMSLALSFVVNFDPLWSVRASSAVPLHPDTERVHLVDNLPM